MESGGGKSGPQNNGIVVISKPQLDGEGEEVQGEQDILKTLREGRTVKGEAVGSSQARSTTTKSTPHHPL